MSLPINSISLSRSIEGINFNENATNNGFFLIPPDPSGAAGLNHVVSVVNSSIQWYTKDGILQSNQSLKNFFAAAVPGTTDDPLTTTFDPKVIYDQYSDRFVVVTLEEQGTGDTNPTNDRSRIYVAVSDDGDPNGTWYGYAINSAVNVGSTNYWADYPGFAVDQQAIYITNNLFSFPNSTFGGSRAWIIPKTPFYSGGTPSNAIYNPSTVAGFELGTLQIAQTFGATPGNTGTFFVATQVDINAGGQDFVNTIRIDNPISNPTFNYQAINVGDINTSFGPPDAPQLGGSTLVSTNDSRAINAVWRDNNLYLVNTVNPPSGTDAGQATVHWYKINTTNLNALTLADQGNIGGEDIVPGTSTFFPSIAVNKVGDIAVGFAGSASSIYPGAYYSVRRAADPTGTFHNSQVLRAGQDYYVRTFGGTENRWGDYSATVVDPSDNSFWVYNEYALTRGSATGVGDDGRWGTAFGNFTPNTPPTAVTLSNQTTSILENTSTIVPIKVADIGITDDGLGTNNLSVSGTDASFFEIVGNALYVKANTTLNYEAKNSYSVTVNVDDPTVGTTPDATTNYTLTLTDVNEAPVVSNFIAPQAVTKDSTFSYTFGINTFTDPEGSTLTYSTSTLPNGVLFTPSTRTFSGKPTVVDTNSITVSASDGVNTTSTSFSLIVTVPVVTTNFLDQSGATSGQIINGTTGSDSVFGSNFNDTIRAGDGNDIIYGNDGNDRLYGDGGDDILVGGKGIDNLYGGLGNDKFVLQPSAYGLDIVNDFQDGFDKIAISTADSGGLTFNDLTFTAFGATGTSTSIRTGGVEIMKLINVNTSLITSADFITISDNF